MKPDALMRIEAWTGWLQSRKILTEYNHYETNTEITGGNFTGCSSLAITTASPGGHYSSINCCASSISFTVHADPVAASPQTMDRHARP